MKIQKRHKSKMTLNEHLERLDQNQQASDHSIAKVCMKIEDKFRKCGYKRIAKDGVSLVKEYVDMIFETQDYRCTFWVPTQDGELNGIWNAPAFGMWKLRYVVYEIDHVHPMNAGGKDDLTNYQFLSANANRFTKCSLTAEDLLRRVDLSKALKDRLRLVAKRREDLFKSEKWKNFIERCDAFEKTDKNCPLQNK